MKNTKKDKKNVVIGYAVRFLISAGIVGMCIFGIMTYQYNEVDDPMASLAGWIVALPLMATIPFWHPIEKHESYHVYADKRYNDLLGFKDLALNSAQEHWTKRLLTYLKACSASNSKVTPEEMEEYIKKCYNTAMATDFGAKDSVCFEDVNSEDTAVFAEKIKPFVYAED